MCYAKYVYYINFSTLKYSATFEVVVDGSE